MIWRAGDSDPQFKSLANIDDQMEGRINGIRLKSNALLNTSVHFVCGEFIGMKFAFWQNSIARTMVLYTIGFSSLLTLILTSLQLANDFRSEVDLIDYEIRLIKDGQLESLEKAVWYFNEIQINVIIEGFSRNPNIQYVEVNLHTGEKYHSGSKNSDGSVRISRLPLLYHGNQSKDELGEVVFHISYEGIYNKLINRFVVIILSNGLKTFCVAFFILWMVNVVMTKRMVYLAKAAKQIGENRLAQPIVLPGNRQPDDEITLLADKMETMRKKIISTLEDHKKAAERAEMANMIKTHFVANVSHELRTPLNGLLGFIELLSQDLSEGESDQNRKYLEVIGGSAARLERIIADLLITVDFEINEIKLDKRSCSISELWQQIQSDLRVMLDRKELSVVTEIDCSDEIHVDQIKLKQAMSHLLFNAIKFSYESGVIEFKAHKEDDFIIIAITDYGIGLDSVDLQSIFEWFYQVDGGLTRKYEGLGIGLTICKNVVEAHGGKIEVCSQRDLGSTFRIILPSVKKDVRLSA